MKVLIVDDDKLVRDSLKTILINNNIKVSSTAKNAIEALELYKVDKPDIVLMDIRMGETSGIEATRNIINYNENAKILLLTTFNDRKYIRDAVSIGAKGYILKENFSSIISAIKSVYQGNMVFDSSVIGFINSKKEINLSKYNLNDRQIKILQEIAKGLSNREIADNLFLSEGTVRNYISAMLDELNLRDRTQLAIFYYKNTYK